MRLLIAEDDEVLLDGIYKVLSRLGYTVDTVSSGDQADAALRTNKFDLAILDLGLPIKDGLEVLSELRGRKDSTPVLILTARDSLEDRVKGLNVGADDYMVKPFDLPELEARVKALIRRSKYDVANEITFGPLKFDVVNRVLTANEEPLELSAREMLVTECLMQRPGRLVSKEQILEQISGFQSDISTNAIEVYVHRVRKRIEPFGVTIKAMRGLGYILEQK